MPVRTTALLAMLLAARPGVAASADGDKPLLNPQTGYWECQLASEYEGGAGLVRVLLPEKLETGKTYPVLYILPVAGVSGGGFGSGLDEAKKTNAADRHGVICVFPSFAVSPWYGNHATDPAIRQEDYILRRLIPWVEQNFPARRDAAGRWLLGFSKSGWGAYTLLLRHPDQFGRAAAWDAPLMLNGDNWGKDGKDWGPMGLSAVMGTKENMQQHFLPTALTVSNAARLGTDPRLVLGAGKFWQGQVEQFHALLLKQNVPHVYRADLLLPHHWDSGWFAPMLEELVKLQPSAATR